MLKLLLDEHISPRVAAGLRRRDSGISVQCFAEWENGGLLGQDDAACLAATGLRGWTLVTYDRRTIPRILKQWGEENRHHAGVIFVDEKTLAPDDIGGLVCALAALFKSARHWDWKDRICFLRR